MSLFSTDTLREALSFLNRTNLNRLHKTNRQFAYCSATYFTSGPIFFLDELAIIMEGRISASPCTIRFRLRCFTSWIPLSQCLSYFQPKYIRCRDTTIECGNTVSAFEDFLSVFRQLRHIWDEQTFNVFVLENTTRTGFYGPLLDHFAFGCGQLSLRDKRLVREQMLPICFPDALQCKFVKFRPQFTLRYYDDGQAIVNWLHFQPTVCDGQRRILELATSCHQFSSFFDMLEIALTEMFRTATSACEYEFRYHFLMPSMPFASHRTRKRNKATNEYLHIKRCMEHDYTIVVSITRCSRKRI